MAARVREGRLGFIALHSAHWAKPFVRLMQDRARADALAQVPEAERATAKWEYVNDNPIYKGVKADTPLTPSLVCVGEVWRLTLPQCVFPAWRADGAPSHVTTLLPQHPIAAGLPARWDIPQTEMYSEPFHAPVPDEVVFEEQWDKGEHFRSGCVWKVGKGRVFYFRLGHETYPVYEQAEPLRVIENAVRRLARPQPETAIRQSLHHLPFTRLHLLRRHLRGGGPAGGYRCKIPSSKPRVTASARPAASSFVKIALRWAFTVYSPIPRPWAMS